MSSRHQTGEAEVVVAGHICLDIIPTFNRGTGDLQTLLMPGKLTQVGPAVVSTGGAVSNTGIALHRLGVRTWLMGKVGDDLIGHAILDVVRAVKPALADGMIIAKGESSSYTVVISPPATDRIFLHCPGANDTFGVSDIVYKQLKGARLFHFGYPPLMRRMYAEGGKELESMFQGVRKRGLITSLDMAMPGSSLGTGQPDWISILKRILPFVDIFLPSLEEILLLLNRKNQDVNGSLLSELSAQLLDWGAGMVVLKLGDQGLYVRTRESKFPGWKHRELLAPCFQVDVLGTTGSGDCTIAGFLAGFLRGLSPEDVMTAAVGVGASSCEKADATTGVPTWENIQRRIRVGWKRLPLKFPLPDWRWDAQKKIWYGSNDQR